MKKFECVYCQKEKTICEKELCFNCVIHGKNLCLECGQMLQKKTKLDLIDLVIVLIERCRKGEPKNV